MSKQAFFLAFFFSFIFVRASAQPIFSAQNGTMSIFSKTSLEDISGESKAVKSILNTTTNEVLIIASIRQFHFPKGLMEEHFNENYMESDKYPTATYTGKINETIDYSVKGTYPVTTTGKLKIHGVEKDRTEKGTLTIDGSKITMHASLKIKMDDFKIDKPKLVNENIAEEIDVTLDIPYTPYIKPESK